ncbi:MAG: type II toxin-antitoxin system prevent-host-death family antitoxin [Actinobacteria bacterium]|nr:type II toxin-antitoxin system prevent-host-death family antitoxin [Actinomycetota bacterium]
MVATIPLRDLRNRTSEVLRRAEAGEEITITVAGRPVARPGPIPHRQTWLSRDRFHAVFGQTHLDYDRFMADVRPVDRERIGDDDRW